MLELTYPMRPKSTSIKHKFHLAFENNYCKEYMKEKVFKILEDHIFTVPLVRGSGPYKDLLPPGSYIDAGDFASPLRLAQYLKQLDKNDTLYMGYFKTRKDYQCHSYSSSKTFWICQICDSISCLKKQKGRMKKMTKQEIAALFHKNKNCFIPK